MPLNFIRPTRSVQPQQSYLASSTVVDAHHPAVKRQARALATLTPEGTISACFRYVRDEIAHSGDAQRNPITCRASEVLRHGTGYCYAKSHLLCALLRANQIPTGLCYQRLALDDHEDPPTRFCLHGLTAVWMDEHGWYRLDPRGTRADLQSEFSPPVEVLPFSPGCPGEYDLAEIYAEPLPQVVKVLREHSTWQDVAAHLPDSENA